MINRLTNNNHPSPGHNVSLSREGDSAGVLGSGRGVGVAVGAPSPEAVEYARQFEDPVTACSGGVTGDE
jgi:hypothetical protein